jgi:hypothetical protein
MDDPKIVTTGNRGMKRAASLIAAGVLLSAVAIMSIGRSNGDTAMEGGGEILLGVGFLVGTAGRYFIK